MRYIQPKLTHAQKYHDCCSSIRSIDSMTMSTLGSVLAESHGRSLAPSRRSRLRPTSTDDMLTGPARRQRGTLGTHTRTARIHTSSGHTKAHTHRQRFCPHLLPPPLLPHHPLRCVF